MEGFIDDQVIHYIKQYFIDELMIKEDKLVSESSLRNDFGLDSIGITELVLQMEMKFNIEINGDEADQISTFGNVLWIVDSKIRILEERNGQ